MPFAPVRFLPALLLAVLLPVMAMAQEPAVGERTVSVTGEGEVSVEPDQAHLVLGVTSEGETAAAAFQAASRTVAGVLDLLKTEGIGPRDLQTAGLSLEPRYSSPQRANGSERPKVVGYAATNQISVRTRDLSKLGRILDRVVAAGATDIRGIRFDIADREKIVDEARRKAVDDARRKALLYAQAAGLKLGPVVTLAEDGSLPARPLAGRAMAAEALTPIEPGELTVTARVHTTWKLVD